MKKVPQLSRNDLFKIGQQLRMYYDAQSDDLPPTLKALVEKLDD